jgi:pilus assembly protein CpaE
VRSVLISTDPALREILQRTVALNGHGLEFAMDLATPLQEITEEQVTELRRIDPQLVVLDFAQDPAIAISFARFLTEGSPQRLVVGSGPELAAETLLEAMRAGVAEYLPKPLSDEGVTGALGRAARRLGWAPVSREPGKLYALFSPKGGAGTTSVATNLAIVLHQLTGKRTLLVDLDFELGEVAVLLGVRPRFSFVDLVQNFHRVDAGLLGSYIERHESGVDFLSAPYHPEPADGSGRDQIRAILHYLRRQYDYVVVDTPKSFSLDTLAAFEEAEHILVVTTVDVPSLRNLQRCLPLFERVTGKSQDRLRLVVNRYQPDDLISLDDVHKTVGVPVYWKLSNDYEAVSRAINSGTPVARNGKSRYARDLQALGADLVGVDAPSNGGGRASGARMIGDLLGRFRKRSDQRTP